MSKVAYVPGRDVQQQRGFPHLLVVARSKTERLDGEAPRPRCRSSACPLLGLMISTDGCKRVAQLSTMHDAAERFCEPHRGSPTLWWPREHARTQDYDKGGSLCPMPRRQG